MLWHRLESSQSAETCSEGAVSPWRVDRLQEGAEVPDAGGVVGMSPGVGQREREVLTGSPSARPRTGGGRRPGGSHFPRHFPTWNRAIHKHTWGCRVGLCTCRRPGAATLPKEAKGQERSTVKGDTYSTGYLTLKQTGKKVSLYPKLFYAALSLPRSFYWFPQTF